MTFPLGLASAAAKKEPQILVYIHMLLQPNKRGKVACTWTHCTVLSECECQVLLLKKLRDETRIDTQRKMLEPEIVARAYIPRELIPEEKKNYVRPRPILSCSSAPSPLPPHVI